MHWGGLVTSFQLKKLALSLSLSLLNIFFTLGAGNPRVTPEVTRDVCLLARMMAANLYYSQIEDLMFEVLNSICILQSSPRSSLFQVGRLLLDYCFCTLSSLFSNFSSYFCSYLCGGAMMSFVFVQTNYIGQPRKMQSTIQVINTWWAVFLFTFGSCFFLYHVKVY